VNNPKALELAQKLAKVEGERATKQRQYNGLETLFSNVRTECETLKRDLRDQTARLEAENLSLLTSNTALRGRAEIAERAKAEAEAHAANLQEGNARLARESAEKDGLLADYRQALLDNDRAGQGGAIILAALVAVVTACATWLVRGWVR
jgi:Skp family chaperone for outer membrane proteins